ncbi:minor allergen alt a 7 [Mycena leptocephala]|nr:minor allergen alt a 7 [Mycena leptocephala]
MYGHVTKMAESVKAGIEEAGGSATLYQCVLAKMYAPAKPLAKYDAFLMGVPTRFGNFPAQWKAFWDSTSSLWSTGALTGKYAGAFTSTAGPGGGQEVTILNTISTLTHHGVLYVPLGYAHAFKQLTGPGEVHGGSPWGAGTFAAADGSRQPTTLELEVARIQGKTFYGVVNRESRCESSGRALGIAAASGGDHTLPGRPEAVAHSTGCRWMRFEAGACSSGTWHDRTLDATAAFIQALCAAFGGGLGAPLTRALSALAAVGGRRRRR